MKRVPNDRERRLADRLKREARATRPAFSETLHGRICRAVEREEKGAASDVPGADGLHAKRDRLIRPEGRFARIAEDRFLLAPRVRRRWLYAAVAAALLVGAALLTSRLVRSPLSGTAPLAKSSRQAPSVEPADAPPETLDAVADPETITRPTRQVAEHFSLLADEAASEGQWAYLDHDVRVAVRLLVEQLPLDASSTENL